jgi:peptidoglycan/LPS O-acetylase OafA/YrhL
MDKIYFKGLNGIRAIAALIVITFHTDQFTYLFGIEPLGYHKTMMAGFGVTLFFVLSGYLITYLLVTEKSKFGRVDLQKFYIRRILRIWPIYYLIILLAVLWIVSGMLVVPAGAFTRDLPLYLFLLPNVEIIFRTGILMLVPLWSVGVEEQFYAFWPLLVNKATNIFSYLIWVVVIYLVIKICLRVFENGNLYSLASITTFDSMAFGGIMANFYFQKNKILFFFYNPAVQAIAWLFLGISVFYKPVHIFSLFDTEIHSIVYAVIIVNVSTNPRTLISLENPVMNFLGRISYGLYIFHMTVIWALSLLLKNTIRSFPGGLRYVLVYIFVYGTTMLIAHLSYNYFESYFLRKKVAFSNVHSTN